jgi:hypothetical protein
MLSRYNLWWLPKTTQQKFENVCRDNSLYYKYKKTKVDDIIVFRMLNEHSNILFDKSPELLKAI